MNRLAAFQMQIERLLLARGWSRTELAQKLGTNNSNVHRDLSKGQLQKARVSRLLKLAQVFGMDLEIRLVAKDAPLEAI